MKKLTNNHQGFAVIELVILIAVIAAIGLIGWKAYERTQNNKQSKTSETSIQKSSTEKKLLWMQTEKGWQAMGDAPSCPSQPMLKSPADINEVTSILYPGQTRGGNYKPHGGFRFDNTTENHATVRAPIDGFIVKGSRYFAEGTSEVQYTFDVMNNCGVMFRVGHLRELPAKLQKIADTFPAPSADSRLNFVQPAIHVDEGEVLATKVGIINAKNTFFDFGVYDYRQENQASTSTAYQSAHSQDKELSWHAVCWLNQWLPSETTAKIASLPAGDPVSGKNSDYCG